MTLSFQKELDGSRPDARHAISTQPLSKAGILSFFPLQPLILTDQDLVQTWLRVCRFAAGWYWVGVVCLPSAATWPGPS
jgi:hypothetical protein